MEQPPDRSETTDRRENAISGSCRYKAAECAELHLYGKRERQNEEQFRGHPSRSSSHTSTEYEDEDEDEDEDEGEEGNLKLEEMRYADARMGICSVCHYPITGKDAEPSEFERALLCANGHLLCYRCVQRFAVKSETSCVLCAAVESQPSTASISRTSSLPSRQARSPRKSRRRPGRCWGAARPPGGPGSASERGGETSDGGIDAEAGRPARHSGDSGHSGSKPRSCCSIARDSRESREGREDDGDGARARAAAECSRRPIRCPRQDCAVNVAFSALTNHFAFDHPEVPIISVEAGEESIFIVDFDGLGYDSSRCLALLLVSGKLPGPASKQFNGSNVHLQYKNRLPLPILAARLRCESEAPGDVVIVWVAGLDLGNITTGSIQCSVQAVGSMESEAFRSLTYTGPINSLRTAQKPRDVFVIGDCVVLHAGFINHITPGCQNLNVNVTIH